MLATMNNTPVKPIVVREKKYKVTIKASVKDADTGQTLIKEQCHEVIVAPPEASHSSKNALSNKCESLARDDFSSKLWKTLEADPALADKLEGRDWYIFAKTTKILPLF